MLFLPKKKKKERKKKKEKMLKGVEKKLLFDKRKKTQKPLIKKNKGKGTQCIPYNTNTVEEGHIW